ncbi:M48 family metallopeptidase [Roseovarius sp. LXJ103]|uniref:M48 family metallopeptidase n=1 Tax=Roseovarius carneus TaxID=2853164 RepID=UPI000D605F0E|nr:M48 family metallopeptidase [Roseovarius carneus]MBZ8117257.1 M48 family metallopeptidase [Roseovarius carneus]PWE36916.1 peptidase M48 [Pelagicola sp. LXJ1103]
MLPVKGRYFDGITSARHEVQVTVSADRRHLQIVGSSLPEPLSWPLPDLRALRDRARPGRLTVTLHAASDYAAPRDPARLTVTSAALSEELMTLCPELLKTDMRAGAWGRLIKRGALAVAAVVLMLFVILPRMADTLAGLIPVEREVTFGKSVVSQIERALGAERLGELRCEAPEGLAALDAMTARLTAGSDVSYGLEMQVFDHEMINAFAAPGGQIVIMRGLLENASGPDAVAAVLAHEIAHVERRDATRHALRAAGSAGILSMVLGDVTGGAAAVFLGERMLQASYTREAEAKADIFALDMLSRAGVSSAAMADFFDVLADMEGGMPALPAYFSSHPASAARAEAARNHAEGQGATSPVLTEAEWAALRAVCD